MLKIVIDTNALIDGSEDYYHYANRILDLVISGNVQAFANYGTLRENRLLVGRKVFDEEYLRKIEYYFGALNIVNTTEKVYECEDEEDNKILESALTAQADYIITSDRHLLDMENFRGTKIVRPAEFWSRWEDEGDSGWMKWMKDFIG